MKATFTAEGRKKNCIIKLEEIEKISSVHRGENEDNAHFIKNPHIFTYLHILQAFSRDYPGIDCELLPGRAHISAATRQLLRYLDRRNAPEAPAGCTGFDNQA